MPNTIQPSDLPPGATADDLDDHLDDVMTPDMTDGEAERARPISEAPASLQAALPKNRGGRPPVEHPKVHVSLRLDPDVLAAYKETGAGWQGRVNDALREGAGRLGEASSGLGHAVDRLPSTNARSRGTGQVRSNTGKAAAATDRDKGS